MCHHTCFLVLFLLWNKTSNTRKGVKNTCLFLYHMLLHWLYCFQVLLFFLWKFELLSVKNLDILKFDLQSSKLQFNREIFLTLIFSHRVIHKHIHYTRTPRIFDNTSITGLFTLRDTIEIEQYNSIKLPVFLFIHLTPSCSVTVNSFIENNSLFCCFWIDLPKHMIALNSDEIFHFFKYIERN